MELKFLFWHSSCPLLSFRASTKYIMILLINTSVYMSQANLNITLVGFSYTENFNNLLIPSNIQSVFLSLILYFINPVKIRF